ncbi:hypothetical protein OSJ77_19970 [Phyllobacterium sp. 0TCS1.6C]|uniref:hypothetical protein n=1 Tax=unclassified Phyllobacterium TaxID=2638441 RepID=UPI00226421CA|nr:MULTISPECIES: hypothetical protein [unclassified Phyllobacterium]MCX8282472.1 hypothetical protein [Phyllobacterium sp. 0TCS1.6C]MCX8292564.1 hypothetical protein [Phyllobacterium sp. 0TCS1.6A]
MNEIMYPADEIAKSFVGLNRTPAPLGHPTVNGKFVSASDPEGINLGWIGAWNENVRREKGRVFLDKVIDVEMANRSEGGKAVLNAIEKGGPIHTSTGLYCMMEAANGEVPYKNIARDIVFDHDAILLDAEGAATPEQGVGMLVNAKGEQEEVEVINSAIDEADRDLEWALDSAVRALEKRQRAPLIERLKTALIEAFGSEREPSANRKEADMTVSKEQFDELSAKVNTLSESLDKIGDTIANAVQTAVKPLTDNLEQLQANQRAKDEAELAGLVDVIVKANILDEESAKELTLNAARKLAEKAKPGKAATINGAFKPSADKPAFQLPEGDK